MEQFEAIRKRVQELNEQKKGLEDIVVTIASEFNLFADEAREVVITSALADSFGI